MEGWLLMECSNVTTRVMSILAKAVEISAESIGPHSHLENDLGMDSYTAVTVVFELENEFGVEIPNEDVRRLRTVADIAVYIDERMRSADPPSLTHPQDSTWNQGFGK